MNGTYLCVWGHGKWSNPSFFFLSHVLPHSVAFFCLLSCVSLSVLSLTPSQRLFLSASFASSFFFYCCLLQQLNQLLKDAITAHVHKRMNPQKTIKKNEWIMYILCIYFLPCVSLFSSVSLETLRALVLLRTVTLKLVPRWEGSPVSPETSYPEWFHSPLICNTLFLHAMQGLHFRELLLATWSQAAKCCWSIWILNRPTQRQHN